MENSTIHNPYYPQIFFFFLDEAYLACNNEHSFPTG